MAKQPEFKKYLPLEQWFRQQPTEPSTLELTFAQVEAILGNKLPASTSRSHG